MGKLTSKVRFAQYREDGITGFLKKALNCSKNLYHNDPQTKTFKIQVALLLIGEVNNSVILRKRTLFISDLCLSKSQVCNTDQYRFFALHEIY